MAIEFIDRTAKDNEYLHRDFHLTMNLGLTYIGERYGEEGVKDYIAKYARRYFSPMTLSELEAYFKDIYNREKADDVLSTELTDTSLKVTVKKCPAVAYLKSKGAEVSKYYVHTTSTLYENIADICGLKFELDYYNEEDGATAFSFRVS